MADQLVVDQGTTSTVEKGNMPALTLPQYLAFFAFLIFVGLAFVSAKTVTGDEYDEVRKLAVFLIGALLPSDALIRFGRALFARDVDDAEAAVDAAPRATVPQYLAFGAYVVVVLLTLARNDVVDTSEFSQINTVAVFLIAALLPSEAAIRFGRALYLRDEPATALTRARVRSI